MSKPFIEERRREGNELQWLWEELLGSVFLGGTLMALLYVIAMWLRELHWLLG